MSDVSVSAEIIEREMIDAEDDQDELTYSGAYRVFYVVKLHWRKDGISYDATDGGELEGEVGSSGMDPKTVEFRQKVREGMYGVLGKLVRRVGKQAGVSHKQALALAEPAFKKASGE